jgi:hypothetical protein
LSNKEKGHFAGVTFRAVGVRIRPIIENYPFNLKNTILFEKGALETALARLAYLRFLQAKISNLESLLLNRNPAIKLII